MVPLLVFLSGFAYFLAGLSPSIGPGDGGFWAAAGVALAPRGPARDPVTILLGHAAGVLLPFGSPAFRMNALGALMTAAAIPLLMSVLRRRTGPEAPAPAALELARDRARDAAAALATFLWVFSAPVGQAAAAWGPGAPRLLATVVLCWAVARRPARGRVVGNALLAVLGGLTLALDPRFLWAAVAALPVFLIQRIQNPKAFFQAPLLAVAALLGWTAGSMIFAALDAATLAQTLRAVWADAPARLAACAVAPRAFTGDDLAALGRDLFPFTPAAAPFAVWGLLRLWKREQVLTQSLLAFWAVGTLGPWVFGPNPGDGGLAWSGLAPLFFVAAGAADLLVAHPRVQPAVLALIPLAFLLNPFGRARARLSPLDQGNDILVSLPPGARLDAAGPSTAAALDYLQSVLNRRPDVTVSTGPALSADEDNGYVESFDRLPTPEAGAPEGVVIRRERLPLFAPTAAAVISLGRVPLFFLTPRSDAPGGQRLSARAHRNLGETFQRHRVMDEAETELITALSLAPKNTETNRALGRLSLDLGDGARAALLFERAVRVTPAARDAADLYGEWATALMAEGKISEAVEALGNGVARDPADDGLRERWADGLEKNGRPRAAADQWRVLRDRHPEGKNYHWRLTQALGVAGDPVKAYQSVERYLALPLTPEERRDATVFRDLLAESVSKINTAKR